MNTVIVPKKIPINRQVMTFIIGKTKCERYKKRNVKIRV